MTEIVRRVYVEKRVGFDLEAKALYQDLKENLGLKSLEGVRVVNRYDVSGITDEEYNRAKDYVFAEPPVDMVFDEHLETVPGERFFAAEYLPGQFDLRADSAAQCIQILTGKERPPVLSARVIILQGAITDDELKRVKEYYINPVESREASPEKPSTLELRAEHPADVETLADFTIKTADELEELRLRLDLAMDTEDLLFCQEYFRIQEKREPTLTEIKVLDTYWSDHCRHTTFLTAIDEVEIAENSLSTPIKKAYREYLASRQYVYGGKIRQHDVCLMDVALMGMKELKKRGLLEDLEESEEINASSITVKIDVGGQEEEWLLMFKNETHNHPTEIEPFGGAATCLGGCIRDPLSGRSYVYQAMRLTGSGDPRTPVEETLPGKLPQRKITGTAAAGYSSYGNQIGVPTGQVAELYHEGYVAKRMEVGAVIGAAPRQNVIRQSPSPGDVVILLGGRTGRDGCGGATGSSREHTEESLTTRGAEVQKGNAPEERKIQRLFRNPRASRLIKKCNDFGAGGVSVAIGELTDGVEINLDTVPKKYEGLDGTELAISESQERMAVVTAAENAVRFINMAAEENLEATVVATVTARRRLKMFWRDKPIVDLNRDFLNTNGVKKHTRVAVEAPSAEHNYFRRVAPEVQEKLPDLQEAWLANLRDLNVCSQKGMVEMFDSTVGAATVLNPLGGKHQLTPAEGMAARLPVLNGETHDASLMTFGYNPFLSSWSPFHGGLYAVVEAAAKVVALGGDYRGIRLTMQEYFEKLGEDPLRWGKPFSALLGAFLAQKKLGIPSIGGKDSMSGTFMELDVPPTLAAFAVKVADSRRLVSQEFKKAGSRVVLVPAARDENEIPDFDSLKSNFQTVHRLISSGAVHSSSTVKTGGIAAAISKMAFGNRMGMAFGPSQDPEQLFAPDYGSIILELAEDTDLDDAFGSVPYILLGRTTEEEKLLVNDAEIPLAEALAEWEKPLEPVFPTRIMETPAGKPPAATFAERNSRRPGNKVAEPRVFIPLFPGTNCEHETIKAFEKAGAVTDSMVFRNLTPRDVEESIGEMKKRIDQAQIVMLPGGFSAGDEPDGSGKFIAAVFRSPALKEAIMKLLQEREGLMLGICNGFQALIKLGLVPYGKFRDLQHDSPTIAANRIGRHTSCLVRTRITSTLSPWFAKQQVGEIHTLAISHGEGRFTAGHKEIEELFAGGQVASQYVDFQGEPSYDITFNPNSSLGAVEGLTSPDGRILGKMGHSERTGPQVAMNVPGFKEQRLFEAGVAYFK